MPDKPTTAQSKRSAETRARVLDAALAAFAVNGLAGARTEDIAAAAGVNKALIYYYFDSKEKLYQAALELSAERIRDSSMAVFLREASPGERILRIALSHFDRIAGQREFQSLMQQEMIRLHKGESDAMSVIIKRVFAPMLEMYQSTVLAGIESGELVDVDWLQMHFASLGANVFYFLSAPVWRRVLPTDPMAPETLLGRRVHLVEYLGQTVFVDRQRGAVLAAKVLAETAIPEIHSPVVLGGNK
jgi:TetR/AcrR family transcriptional regulator